MPPRQQNVKIPPVPPRKQVTQLPSPAPPPPSEMSEQEGKTTLERPKRLDSFSVTPKVNNLLSENEAKKSSPPEISELHTLSKSKNLTGMLSKTMMIKK